MKKVIVPGVKEEAEFECDRCGENAFGQLMMHFWYGSSHDMSQSTIHLCDECADKVIENLKTNLKINVELKEIIEL